MPAFTTHVSGLGFPEGPVPGDQGDILFTDLRHQCIYRWSDDAGVEVVARTGGAPNGMRRGPDGLLYIANNGGLWPTATHGVAFSSPQLAGSVQRLDDAAALIDVVRSTGGDGPRRPNDLVFAPDGRIVFTDPRNWEVLPDRADYETGRIWLGTPGEEPVEIARVEGFPNGLAFLPDGSLLVGLTEDKALVRYGWEPDGALTEPEVWARLEPRVGADGVLVADDVVVVAGSVSDSLLLFDLEGRLLDEWSTGEGSDPTNLCVGFGRLWVTCGYGGSLISTPWPAS